MCKDDITTNNSAHNYYKVIQQHRLEYFRRPALQAVYKHWASRIRQKLSQVDGKSVELGCGCGALSHHLELIKTDIYKHAWVDEVVDACNILFGASRLNHKIIDMPIRYRERSYGDIKISLWKHGWLLLKMSLVAFRKLKLR